MALKDWEDIRAFEKDAVEAQHLDVVYILRRLMARRAFLFTAMPTLVTPLLHPWDVRHGGRRSDHVILSHQLSYNKKKKAQHLARCQGFMEAPSRPQELLGPELTEVGSRPAVGLR